MPRVPGEAVDRHLADCPSCAGALAAMQAPDPKPEAAAEEQAREVDYLKRVKIRNTWRIVSAAVLTGCVVIAAFLFQLFERGTPLNHETVAVTELSFLPAEGDPGCPGTLSLFLTSTDSGRAFHNWQVIAGDDIGVSYITAREVLASPLHPSGSNGMDVTTVGLREIWLGNPSGQLLWQDGVVISPMTLELMDVRVTYCGDPTALTHIADILNLRERLGDYTLSLQTGKHPYGCILEFANRLNDEQLNIVTCYNLLTLALVDNLEAS